jgi:hypothetical protein
MGRIAEHSRRLLVAAIVLLSTTLGAATSAATPGLRDDQAPAPAPSTTSSARSFVLLIDTTTLSAEQLAEVRDAGPAFINRLGSNPRRAAVVTVADRIRIVTDFATGDELRNNVARATNPAVTQAAGSLATADAQEVGQRGLNDACSILAAVTGPKTIVYFSTVPALPSPNRDTTTIDPFAAIQGRLGDMPRACTAANVRLYVIDPHDLPR